MRADTTIFITDNEAGSKEPRYVVSIDFDGTIYHFTSHDDIANVPTTPAILQRVLFGISATSQTLNPDRANATIGSMSFDLIDLALAVTNLIRTELDTNNVGLRGRTCKFNIGYKSTQDGALITDPSSTDDNPDFDEFVLFQTQIVQSVETKEGKYSIKCADIQRETKRQIFDLELTYLTASISATATTIAVLNLAGFEPNNHGTSYTDAPSSNVIYIRIDQTKEIIRCPFSGISGNSFTGVTRGALNTTAKAVEVDLSQASDRRPKVEEYVYLELPAVKLAYAILTGVIEGTADVLPSSWHAGVATSFVRLTDFQNIGRDLWITSDDTAGVVLRFDGIEKQDAKKFLETEIYLLLGLFSPVYADGQLGLKRMVPSLPDSPFRFELTNQNVSSSGNLKHDMESMQNNLRIDWNWNGDRFIRSTIVVDSASIARHGSAPEKRMGFRGLAGTRFTEQVLRQLLTSLRDMYTGPPLRLDVNCFHMFNRIEVGDAARVDLPNLRDYTQTPNNLQRTMVVHGMTVDWLKGVKLKLFGSAERASEIAPFSATSVLPNAFYASVGTALNTIPGLMTGDATNAGTFTLVGSADMNAAASVFYHDAPLTITSTTTLNIEGNVQIRVRGFITIDGTIDGTGEGLPTDTNLFDSGQHYYWAADEQVGTPGFIGNSQSHSGLLYRTTEIPSWVWVTGGYHTEGRFDAFPNIVLVVDDAGSGSIAGIPTDMRGGGGAFGPRAGEKLGIAGRTFQRATGGAGGAGGAALLIICRGGDFGIAGQITLDGADSVEPATSFSADGFNSFGGAGGAGAPGALLWLLDGSAVTFPDIAGSFSARTGDVPAQFALPFLDGPGQNRNLVEVNAPANNMAPFLPNAIRNFDQTGVNFRISFLPGDVVAQDDQDNIVSAPASPSVTSVVGGVQLAWTNTNQERIDVFTEIWLANEDVRASAVLIATVAGEIYDDLTGEVQRARYYWLRHVDADGNVSLFTPNTSTTTLIAFPTIQQSPIAKDPLIRLGSGEWQLEGVAGSPPAYTVGTGTKGTDTIRWSGAATSQQAAHATRRGPDEFDFEATQGMSIEIRYRIRYTVAGSGGWSVNFLPFIETTDEAEANIRLYGVGAGGGLTFDQNSTLGDWVEKTDIITLVSENLETPPRFVQLRMHAPGNSNGAEYDLDLLDASVQARIFEGAQSAGLVPDPVTEQNFVLRDDGTWIDPTGAVPTLITVTDESADVTCFVAYFNDLTGELAPHTGTNLQFNSAIGNLVATEFAGIASGDLVDKANVETIQFRWTYNDSINLLDNAELIFGTGLDVDMYFSGVDLFIDMPNGADFRLRGGAANDLMIVASDDGAVSLYWNGALRLFTQDNNAADNITGAQVAHWDGSPYDVGLARMPRVFFTSDLVVSDTHWHKRLVHNGTGSLNVTFNIETSQENDVVLWVLAEDGPVVLVEGTSMTLRLFNGAGAAPPTGNITIARAGWATVVKDEDGAAHVTGIGLSS